MSDEAYEAFRHGKTPLHAVVARGRVRAMLTMLGPAFVAVAIVIEEALDHQGILALMVAGFLLVFGPVLTHATARAARIRSHGDWRARPSDKVHRP